MRRKICDMAEDTIERFIKVTKNFEEEGKEGEIRSK